MHQSGLIVLLLIQFIMQKPTYRVGGRLAHVASWPHTGVGRAHIGIPVSSPFVLLNTDCFKDFIVTEKPTWP